jgi:UDP-N-acetylglucosamine 2-epimerase
VKEFLVNLELKNRAVREILIHTGQHYDYEMSQSFFDCFDLPVPNYHLHIANTDGADFLAQAIMQLTAVLRSERPSCVLSYGDVNSTMAAAIAASKLCLPFAHVEGGIRTADRYNPEEINRRVSDVLADVIFCCTKTDVENLAREGYEPERVELSGDLMKDALLTALKKFQIEIERKDYLVLTLHREENLTSDTRLRAILDGIIKTERRVIFPAHPRTVQAIGRFGLSDLIRQSHIELCKPMSYVDFVRLAAGADKILTDSGGVRREAYILRKPCIVLFNLSWFPEILKTGWMVLVGPEPNRIADLIRTFEPAGPYPELLGDGRAYHKIVDVLVRNYAS